jgi:hypothetical protein
MIKNIISQMIKNGLPQDEAPIFEVEHLLFKELDKLNDNALFLIYYNLKK